MFNFEIHEYYSMFELFTRVFPDPILQVRSEIVVMKILSLELFLLRFELSLWWIFICNFSKFSKQPTAYWFIF